MQRRRFLQSLGALGLLSRVRPARAEAPAVPHVVVVGTGPAGFSAALELAERGVRVTLLEAADQVGGKVKGWKEADGAGRPVDAEHAIHGFAEGYVHFTELLERHGLDDVLRWEKLGDAGIRTPDGEMSMKAGHRRKRLLSTFRRWGREAGYGAFLPNYLKGQRYIRKLTRASVRAQWAGKTVLDYVAADLPMTRYRLMPRVISLSLYFVEPEQLDAAVFAISERFNTLKVRWMRGNPQDFIWEPFAKIFTDMGGTLRLNARVTELIVEEARCVGVRIGKPATSITVQEEPDERGITTVAGPRGPIYIGRNADQTLWALSGACTHQGCPVFPSDTGFDCPCHGGRFDAEGAVLQGPPTRPLTAVDVVEGPDGITVLPPDDFEELSADAVVLAVDMPAIKELVGPHIDRVNGLRACRHTAARYWFDRDVDAKDCHAILIDGYAHSSNGFLLHRFQDASAEWAEATGGSAIEIQAFRELDDATTGDALLDAIEADVRAIWPELADAEVLHRSLSDGYQFTWFHPGWYDHALDVQTELPGLLAAGDHVRTDRDCEFMERSVYTGRVAANAILAEHGLEQAPILEPIR